MRPRIAAAVAAVALVLLPASPAAAYEPVNIVHTEQVQAGPYTVTIGFSRWPLRSMQSLDFSFIPDGGIADKTGTVLAGGAAAPSDLTEEQPLSRHPRRRDVWGLDVFSMEAPGEHTYTFRINGPLGEGVGTTRPLTVLDQPGPPLALSWAICAVPITSLVVFLAVAWRRSRPSRHLPALS
ncbi:hypothetical protein [Catenuloplanes atrovinosus]|uniref:Uncharacterized protein n=1 Tax=Catenuloplanes atrovinosus TaxID=137266 RepID=A0AAE3YJ13_9ACTN|nr:hypothetical protein [Catenuloplanes atrovinosus]MDR7274733.1 hypothetical protein [Catenuloplanes atrovinosus]